MTQKGVTLVELMIVILIIGLLALAASPFTSTWVKNARTAEGASAVEEAIGRAKAAALRNTARIIGDKPASLICLTDSNTKVSLIVPSSTVPAPSCDTAAAWSADISSIVSIKTIKDGTASSWACSCFNNKGLPTKEGTVCGACSDSLNFKFSHDGHSGAEGDERNFY